MKKINQPHKKKGFTLIETLVAIFILLVSTTGPLSFAQSGLRASFDARDQIVAFYLAQDAIETIKSLRDNASVRGNDWYSIILNQNSDCVNDSSNGSNIQACQIETGLATSFKRCTNNVCDPMRFNSNTNQFVISGGTESKYTRTVYIVEIEEDREAQIIVEVSWGNSFFSERRIVVQENLFNWVPKI